MFLSVTTTKQKHRPVLNLTQGLQTEVLNARYHSIFPNFVSGMLCRIAHFDHWQSSQSETVFDGSRDIPC